MKRKENMNHIASMGIYGQCSVQYIDVDGSISEYKSVRHSIYVYECL